MLQRKVLGRPKSRTFRRAATALAAVLACAATLAPTHAGTSERTLRLFNTHTGEHAVVTFKRNGQYVAEGLRQANIVLRDWRRNEPANMDPKLLDLVWEVYQESGSNGEIHIVSGYRAPATNAMLRAQSSAVAENSQHMAGRAMDFYLPDVPLARLRSLGLQLQIGGVGYYPTSGSPFIHLDTGSVRHWPRMTRTQLVSVFPEGRSLHIPSDGTPLPGYQEALAEYRSQGFVTPQSREAATFLADLYQGPGARVPVAPAIQTSPEIQVASAAPQVAPPLPRVAPRAQTGAEETHLAAAAIVPPLPRPAPDDGRATPLPNYDYAALQVAAAGQLDLTPPMTIVDASTAAPGEALPIPAMAFAAEFAGSYPDPFRALSAEIGAAAPLTPPAAQPAAPLPSVTMVAAAPAAAAQPAPSPSPRLAVASLIPSFAAAPESRPALSALAGLEPPITSDGADVWTSKSSTRQAEMAALSAPEVEATELVASPERIYAAGFAPAGGGDLRTDRFSGPAVSTVSTAFVLVPNRIQLASR